MMTSQGSAAQTELSELVKVFVEEPKESATISIASVPPPTSLADNTSGTDSLMAQQFFLSFFSVLFFGGLVMLCILRLYFANTGIKNTGDRESKKGDRIHVAHII